uniref:Ig-like domain-containing protein n=1 Tax=Lepisosteus oculatus TaxID=7918 RepID=W5LXT3_LEPOC
MTAPLALGLLLSLAALSCVQSDVVLTQSESAVVTPGGSHRLKCTVTGFNVAGYSMFWIRQAPGKGLEWIVYFYSSSDNNYAPAVQGRFTASKDSSSLYLDMTSLRAEDTAVYYCARDTVQQAFDYWGKGTMVTVTSGSPTKPTLFPLVASCGSGTSGGVVSVGCLATGFLPDSLTFKWTDSTNKELTPFEKYPSVLSGGTYSSTSMVSLSTSDWNSGKSFYCEAKHPQGDVKTDPINPDIQMKTQSLCLSYPTPSSPLNHSCMVLELTEQRQWILQEDKYIIPSSITVKKESRESGKMMTVTTASLVSAVFFLDDQIHLQGTDFMTSCVYVAPTLTSPLYSSFMVFEAPCLQVNLKDADQKELFISNRAVLSCEVEGDNLIGAQVSWTEGGKPATGQLNLTQTRAVSNLTIDASKWYSGEVFECIVQLKSQQDPIKRPHKKFAPCLKQKPTLYILPPSEAEIREKGSATLVCLVTGFFPENIYIMWGENGNLKEEGITSRPVKNNGLYSAMSYLTIAKDQWEKNEYLCAVKHPSLGDNKTAPRMKTINACEGSAWTTALWFIFLFLFNFLYSAILTMSKVS